MRERQKHILQEPVASTIISHRFSHVVWGSIFAGIISVITLQLAFSMLGSGIGLSALNVGADNNAKAVGFSAIAWWLISGTISFYVGGWVAGRMAGIPRAKDGAIHGLLTWASTTLVVFLFITTTVGALIAGGFGMLKSTGQGVAAVAPQIMDSPAFNDMRGDIDRTFNQYGLKGPNQDPKALMGQVTQGLGSISMAGNDPTRQKQQLVNVLVQNTNMTQAEAQGRVDQWSGNLQQLKINAEQKAEQASKVTGVMALASFAMLLLGAIASGVGGSIGAPHWSEQEIA